MLRKLNMTVALVLVLAFGGAFSQTADASANQYEKQVQYKVFYSINGNTGNLTGEDLQQFFPKALELLENKWQKKTSINQGDEKTTEPEKQIEVPKQQEVKEEKPAEKVEESKPVVEEKPQEEVVTSQPVEEQKEDEQTTLSQFEVEVVELTNQERAKQGLQPLQIDEALSKVARAKSQDMAQNHYFDHNSPVYGSPFDMMKSFGINYRTAGENIAKGQRTPAEVVNAWMNSPGHRANILNGNFTHIGVGHIESGNHWTQMFIGK